MPKAAKTSKLFVDGLHPSEAGYRVWRDRLVAALQAARMAGVKRP